MLQRYTHKHAEVHRNTKINRGSMDGIQLGCVTDGTTENSGFNCSSTLDPNSYSKGIWLRREEKAHSVPETIVLEIQRKEL